MNKRHWISLAPGPGVGRELVTELVTNAYLLVTDTLTGSSGRNFAVW
jgi:predicted DNA-binding protein (MmcQ/YjbR family)